MAEETKKTIELNEEHKGECPEGCGCGKAEEPNGPAEVSPDEKEKSENSNSEKTPEEKKNLLDFQALARKQQEDKKQRILATSFHSLKGRDSAEKLDMMFGMIRKLDEDIETFDTKTKSNSIIMEFILNQLDPDGMKLREFTSRKYNLEEMKDGDRVKAGDFVNITMVIKAGDKNHEFPRPEMIISPEEQIEMTPFMGTDLIGMRIGESKIDEKRHIGIKITRGRKRVNTTVKSAQVQEPANDNPGM